MSFNGPQGLPPPPAPPKPSMNDQIRVEEQTRFIALIHAINEQITRENIKEFSELVRTSIVEEVQFIAILSKNRFTLPEICFQQLEARLRVEKEFLEELLADITLRLQKNPLPEKEMNFFKQLRDANEKNLERFLGRMIYILTFYKPLAIQSAAVPAVASDGKPVDLDDLFAKMQLTPYKDCKNGSKKPPIPPRTQARARQRPRAAPPPNPLILRPAPPIPPKNIRPA